MYLNLFSFSSALPGTVAGAGGRGSSSGKSPGGAAGCVADANGQPSSGIPGR